MIQVSVALGTDCLIDDLEDYIKIMTPGAPGPALPSTSEGDLPVPPEMTPCSPAQILATANLTRSYSSLVDWSPRAEALTLQTSMALTPAVYPFWMTDTEAEDEPDMGDLETLHRLASQIWTKDLACENIMDHLRLPGKLSMHY